MDTGKKIDYLIQCLEVAKEEYEYMAKFKGECPMWDDDGINYCNYINSHRMPNKTLIRENLNNVARMARIVSNDMKGNFEV